MSTDLVRSKLERTLQVKSLTDLVRVRASEEVFLLLDISGSMQTTMRNGKQRLEGLREVVSEIGSGRATRMIAFGGSDGNGGAYIVSGVPARAAGGTPLTQAIDLARTQNAGRAIVISDGQPDNASSAMEAAKRFGGKIDVVFVGDPGDYGESFLAGLAKVTGGTEFHGDLSEPKALTSKIMGLLSADNTMDADDGE